eukprot:GABV01012043.1.p1 GENE.GABV01012043.1~~GABV01012043.1.p1  ORF type:complete len:119 (-),score=20.81 GABV01012043.1:11-367(-)
MEFFNLDNTTGTAGSQFIISAFGGAPMVVSMQCFTGDCVESLDTGDHVLGDEPSSLIGDTAIIVVIVVGSLAFLGVALGVARANGLLKFSHAVPSYRRHPEKPVLRETSPSVATTPKH